MATKKHDATEALSIVEQPITIEIMSGVRLDRGKQALLTEVITITADSVTITLKGYGEGRRVQPPIVSKSPDVIDHYRHLIAAREATPPPDPVE